MFRLIQPPGRSFWYTASVRSYGRPMHTTKTDILVLLKRNDGAAVDDLVSALGLASMTIRQHLMALERDALIHAEGVRRATGRPHYHYRLTEEGHRHVAGGYDRMLTLLVEQAGALDVNDVTDATPEQRRTRLFERAAAALGERHRAEVGALDGGERAARLATILRAYGGFAEAHTHALGYEVRDFNCVYRADVRKFGPCGWHEIFLETVLGTAIIATAEPDGCTACCRYIILDQAATPG